MLLGDTLDLGQITKVMASSEVGAHGKKCFQSNVLSEGN